MINFYPQEPEPAIYTKEFGEDAQASVLENRWKKKLLYRNRRFLEIEM